MEKECVFCNNKSITEEYSGHYFCPYHLNLFKLGLISINKNQSIVSVRNCEYEEILYSITKNNIDSNDYFTSHYNNVYQSAILEFEGSNLRVNNLHQILDYLINNASEIYINVSFIRNSGLNLILPQLKEAKNKGSIVNIITSTYMNITEPSALLRLVDNFNVRLYAKNNSFHPKSYFFKLKNGETITIVGSSNISRSALQSGVEWNYIYEGKDDVFLNEFNKLYNQFTVELTHDRIDKYAKVIVPLTVFDEYDKTNEVDSSITPRGFQVEALEKLKYSRKLGQTKGVIIAATGLGKTYLAAFDSLHFNRTLFISHRAEILESAYASFKNVHGVSKSYGRIYNGHKEINRDIIFAIPQSLKKNTLQEFENNYFDNIIIDEFHHAGAKTYHQIIEYFNPKFLLGLTATPSRMDGIDILKICDDNIICDFNLFVGIKNNWLVPFNYYAIFDSTDYSDVKISSSGIIEDSDSTQLFNNENYENTIVTAFKEYHKGTSLIFCVSKVHAFQIAKFMTKQNIKAVALTSDNTIEERAKVIAQLKNKEIDAITSVDLFNEGVDIPQLNSIFMLRQTASSNVFFQQLGRGLRLCENKTKLTVVDLIGNHKNIDKKFSFLHTFNLQMQNVLPNNTINSPEVNMNFDFHLVNIKQKWEQKNILESIPTFNTFMSIFSEYNEETIPSIYDYYISLNDAQKEQFLSPKFRKERNYFYSSYSDILNQTEINILNMVIQTSMNKIYKIPLLLSFIDGDKIINTTNILRNNTTIDYLLLHHSYLFTNENLNQRKNCFDQPKKAFTKSYSDLFEVSYNEKVEYFKFKDDIFKQLGSNFVKVYEDTVMFRAIIYRRKGQENDK